MNHSPSRSTNATACVTPWCGGAGAATRPIESNLRLDAISGGLCGVLTKTSIAPIDRVKLLLQLQRSQPLSPGERYYSNTRNCFRRIYAEQGFLSFWRGNGAAILRVFPQQAINFSTKDKLRALFEPKRGGAGHPPPSFARRLAGDLAAGGTAGGLCLALLYPLDFARTRLATDNGRTAASREFRSTYHCLSATIASDGVRGVYRGFGVALGAVVLFRSIFFGGWDTAKASLAARAKRRGVPPPPLWQRWTVAQAITTLAGVVVYPLDSVRRRMMMQTGRNATITAAASSGSGSGGGVVVPYASQLDCARRVLAEEGWAGFYRGFGANLPRSFGGAMILVLYDEVRPAIHARFGAP